MRVVLPWGEKNIVVNFIVEIQNGCKRRVGSLVLISGISCHFQQ